MKRDVLRFKDFIKESQSILQEPKDLISENEEDSFDISSLTDISNEEFLQYVNIDDISKKLPFTDTDIFIDDYDVTCFEYGDKYAILFLSEYYIFEPSEFINEDACVTTGISGMGAVVSPVASNTPGQTIGGNGSNTGDSFGNGGIIGSGDIGVAFNRNVSKRPTRSRRKQKAMGALKMFKNYSNLVETLEHDMIKIFPFLDKMECHSDIYTYKNDDISIRLNFWSEDKWNIECVCEDKRDGISRLFNIKEYNINFQQLKNCLSIIDEKYFSK